MEITSLDDLTIKVFADGADLDSFLQLYELPYIKGFTTNPTLMAKAEIVHYENFARSVLESITDKPVSFEVFSDEFDDMARQARKINSWADNVYVKIPITNTKGASSVPLIKTLLDEGIAINVTAIFTKAQLDELAGVYDADARMFISIFAGRITDSGRDAVPYIEHALNQAKAFDRIEVLWASCRELFNIVQAQFCGCDIVTVTPDVLKKLNSLGKPLDQFSLETVEMFYRDAERSGFEL